MFWIRACSPHNILRHFNVNRINSRGGYGIFGQNAVVRTTYRFTHGKLERVGFTRCVHTNVPTLVYINRRRRILWVVKRQCWQPGRAAVKNNVPTVGANPSHIFSELTRPAVRFAGKLRFQTKLLGHKVNGYLVVARVRVFGLIFYFTRKTWLIRFDFPETRPEKYAQPCPTKKKYTREWFLKWIVFCTCSRDGYT